MVVAIKLLDIQLLQKKWSESYGAMIDIHTSFQFVQDIGDPSHFLAHPGNPHLYHSSSSYGMLPSVHSSFLRRRITF